MPITHTLTDSSVTILGPDFVPKTMPVTHPAFEQVVQAIKADDQSLVHRLMDLPNAIVTFMQGRIQIADRVLYYDGKPVNNSLTTRILQFMEAGDEAMAKPLINFLEKVKENPSRRAVEGLYDWTVRSGLPITPEGNIIAYKIVRDNYRDIYSGRFDNSVGQRVSVPRNEVDEDPDRTCSHGLHVCGIKYLPHYGATSGGGSDRVMVVEVSPKDFVAVPRDYDCAKARVCDYQVVGQVPAEKAKDFFPSMVSYANFDIPHVSEDVDGPLWDDLEVGEYYRTRDGRVVQIVDFDDARGDGDYPYLGQVLPSRQEEHEYGQRGSWNLYEEHPLDLVEVLPDGPFETEPEQEEKPKGFFGWFFGS